MNPGRFFVPRIGTNMAPMMLSNYLPTRNGVGLFGRITNSLRSVNWSGLLNGANKTLNVVNQSIPLVRQAGPMFRNMKSMFRLAKMFGNETASRKNNSIKNNGISIENDNTNVDYIVQKKEVVDDSYPNFFV